MLRLVILGLAAYGAAHLGMRAARHRPRPLLPPPPGKGRKGRGIGRSRDVDREAMRLAEETDVSPNQAKAMILGNASLAAAEAEARNFKAES